ncbi:MAG TPA: TonB-dependent receptor [Pyrinomonadaceae bacterium]|nr:TonB-dependent receptor [Pyrinomonadaceae bacterium]
MRLTPTQLLRASLCALAIISFSAAARAQFRAGVQGTVTDPAGAVVPEATVTLTSNETARAASVTTSSEGFYRFDALAPGNYTLTVEKAGFKKTTFESVAVNAEQVQGVDVVLTAGEVAEVVTVTETAAPALETENANINKAISTTEVRQLPQFGRDPYELARLTPGVFGDASRGGNGNATFLPNSAGPGGSSRGIFQTENAPQISANGQRISANNFQIDGTSVNSLGNGGAAVVTPNQESVKEVRVIANVYSAEFGRNSGAQVLTVSQNGTNAFHGSLFLKNNSPGLNAFNKYGGPNNAPSIRVNQHLNQFGGSLGGPLPIPNFGEGDGPAFRLGRNRAFFFFSYEGLRSSNSDTVNAFIETPEFRQLVVAQRPNSIAARILGAQGIAPRVISVLPATCARANLPNGDFPLCQPVAGGLDIGRLGGAQGQYLPFTGQGLNGGGLDGIPDIQLAQLAVPNVSRGNQYNPRLDFNLTDRDVLTLSSYVSRFEGTGPDAAGRSRPMGDVSTAPNNLFGMATWVRTLSSSMINEARVNATRFAFNEIESSGETNFGIPRIEIENLPFDRIRFGANWSETTPGVFAENTFEFRDTVRWVRGNQAWSFGGELRKEQSNNDLSGGSRPLYTFAGLFNFANDAPLFYQINADPRTGGPAQSSRAFRTSTSALFAQNDWKVRPNLSINLGLRWEYFSPLVEKNGVQSNLILGPAGSELTGATLRIAKELYPPDRNNFAPRVGFAYSPDFGNSFAGLLNENRMVLRGGFGIAYNRVPVILFANTRGNPPFFARYRVCCGTSAQDFSTPFNNGQILYALGSDNTPFSFPANPALISPINPATGIPTLSNGAQLEIYGAPADVPTPYVYTYSLEGQYNLPGNFTAELGYQGSASRKLVRLVNQRFLYTDPNIFSGVFFPTPDTTASYNALIARLTHRFSRGVMFDATYRWAKSIDIVSYDGPGAGTNPTFPLDVRQERGPSDYDVRHNLVASGVWDLPFLRRGHNAASAILGGWQVSGILTAHTGFPWTPVTGNCPSESRPIVCPARPVSYAGGAGTDYSNDAFVNGTNFPGGGRAFFSDLGATGFGASKGLLPGVGRNSFRGPRYFDVDMSLSKRFGFPKSLGEGTFLEVKANFFNLFNILNLQPFNFNSPSTDINSNTFGRAERGLAGRVIELQGRLNF